MSKKLLFHHFVNFILTLVVQLENFENIFSQKENIINCKKYADEICSAHSCILCTQTTAVHRTQVIYALLQSTCLQCSNVPALLELGLSLARLSASGFFFQIRVQKQSFDAFFWEFPKRHYINKLVKNCLWNML